MNEIYESMIQPKGAAYRESRVASHSHYRDPIDRTPGRPAGNSRIWGDASPEVQSRSVDAIIAASERAGLNVRQTAHVLAIARVESGFNPDAAAGTTSAFGLGQFINKTGEHYGIRHSNRGELTRQADGLVAHFLDNTALAAREGRAKTTSTSTTMMAPPRSTVVCGYPPSRYRPISTDTRASCGNIG